MKVKKNTLKLLDTISKTNCSQIFDWDIIVPDSKPDVSEIISTDGTVNIIGKEIMQDRAVINGNVKINILYLGSKKDKCIKSIECIQPFNYVLEMEKLRQNMKLNLNCIVNKISSNLINSRKINTSCLIDFSGYALEDSEISYIDSLEEENLICKRENIRTQKIKDCISKSVAFNDSIEVPVGKPSIMEILKNKCDIINKDIKFVNNRIVMRGTLKITTIYLCDSDTDCTHYMINEIPVNEVVECEGIKENSVCEYDISVSDFNCVLKDNNENEMRIVKISGNIVIDGKIYEEIDVTPIVDTYSLCDKLEIGTINLNYDEIIHVESGKIVSKNTVEIDSGKEIQKILLVDICEKIDNIKYENGKICIKGNILCGILYTAQDDLMYYKNSMIPLEHIIPCETISKNIFYEINTETDNCSYNLLSGSEIEVRINIEYKLKVKTNISRNIVDSIEVKDENDINKSKKGITVFFCDKDEDLWDIAKRYKKTIEDIVLVNELDNTEVVRKGTKLLIP